MGYIKVIIINGTFFILDGPFPSVGSIMLLIAQKVGWNITTSGFTFGQWKEEGSWDMEWLMHTE